MTRVHPVFCEIKATRFSSRLSLRRHDGSIWRARIGDAIREVGNFAVQFALLSPNRWQSVLVNADGSLRGSKPMTRPAIDHSLLSPSGRMSKRSRRAALKREHGRLFPPGFWDGPAMPDNHAENLRAAARNLRELAARGMSPRKFLREAERLEKEAANA